MRAQDALAVIRRFLRSPLRTPAREGWATKTRRHHVAALGFSIFAVGLTGLIVGSLSTTHDTALPGISPHAVSTFTPLVPWANRTEFSQVISLSAARPVTQAQDILFAVRHVLWDAPGDASAVRKERQSVVALVRPPALDNLPGITSPRSLASKLPAAATRWQGLIARYARAAQVDAQLVNAIILQESRFNPSLVSSAGAIGLMQLTPKTARVLGVNPWNPEENLWGGIWYIGQLLHTYNGNLEMALAAYNAGPGAVRRYGGIPPYGETRHYVPTVLRNYRNLLAELPPAPSADS